MYPVECSMYPVECSIDFGHLQFPLGLILTTILTSRVENEVMAETWVENEVLAETNGR